MPMQTYAVEEDFLRNGPVVTELALIPVGIDIFKERYKRNECD